MPSFCLNRMLLPYSVIRAVATQTGFGSGRRSRMSSWRTTEIAILLPGRKPSRASTSHALSCWTRLLMLRFEQALKDSSFKREGDRVALAADGGEAVSRTA